MKVNALIERFTAHEKEHGYLKNRVRDLERSIADIQWAKDYEYVFMKVEELEAKYKVPLLTLNSVTDHDKCDRQIVISVGDAEFYRRGFSCSHHVGSNDYNIDKFLEGAEIAIKKLKEDVNTFPEPTIADKVNAEIKKKAARRKKIMHEAAKR